MIDWSRLQSLRLRARAVAEGVLAGSHASTKRGSGVEFAGNRAYVVGDDLRLLDRRATARHDRPFVRELETDTERALLLLVDASASMGFCGKDGAASKLAYAAMLAGGLLRVAERSGDPVGVEFLGGVGASGLRPRLGGESVERALFVLERARAGGDLHDDLAPVDQVVARALRSARRGSVIVFFSDLVDLPDEAARRLAALALGRRTLVVCRVLDPEEATFPFREPLRLVPLEGDRTPVETNADVARDAYLARLRGVRELWERGTPCRFVDATTSDDPVAVVRAILGAAARRRAE